MKPVQRIQALPSPSVPARPKVSPALFAAGLLLGCLPARAQIGDFPGEKQVPVIPAEQIPPSPAISPDEALKSFQLAPGIRLEIAASEPLVQEPVAIAFGPDGAMWVVEMRGYMLDVDATGEADPIGRVVVLRDTDGDGRFDHRTLFVDGLVLPRTIALVADGALYIVDLYRGIIQHRMSFTTYLRGQVKARDLESAVHLGRVYRVVPADRTPDRKQRFVSLATPALVQHLSHANAWFRETAQRLLVERRDVSAIPLLREVLRSAPGELARLHALWTLDGMDAVNHETVSQALDDSAATVQVAAIRLAEKRLATAQRPDLIRRLTALCSDRRPEVQLQAVLSLGAAADPAVDAAVAGIVRAQAGNVFLKDAFLSGLRDREWLLLQRLLAGERDASAIALAESLASGILVSRNAGHLLQLFAIVAGESRDPAMRRAILAGLAAAAPTLAKRPLPLPQKPADLSRIATDADLRPTVGRIEQALSWPGREGVPGMTAPKLSADEQQRFEAGEVVFVGTCAACHQPSGSGLAGLAPPLLDSEWILGSPAKLVRIILHGLRGPIVVAGESFTGDMPGFGLLSDEQVSSVATYVRRAWGHSSAPISPAQVAAIRKETEGRMDAWTDREFTKMKIR